MDGETDPFTSSKSKTTIGKTRKRARQLKLSSDDKGKGVGWGGWAARTNQHVGVKRTQ